MALQGRSDEIVSAPETDANKQLLPPKMSLILTALALWPSRGISNCRGELFPSVATLDRLKTFSFRNQRGRATSAAAGQPNGARRS